MRLTSDFWVSALVRRVFGDGGFAAVVDRGATEAGAVFVIARDRTGRGVLYGPAPQTSYEGGRPDDRHFTLLYDGDDASAIDAKLARERRFDPDIWVVEIEAGKTPVGALLTVTP